MASQYTRRFFLKTAAMTLGTVMIIDFTTVAGAKQAVNLRIASSKEMENETMPHVIVKLWPGRSEEQKLQLADAIVKDLVDIMEASEGSVSVAIEEVPSGDWKSKVYDPDIKENWDRLYKKPGYSM
jgi:4-oxalocrotonate tautomerase